MEAVNVYNMLSQCEVRLARLVRSSDMWTQHGIFVGSIDGSLHRRGLDAFAGAGGTMLGHGIVVYSVLRKGI